LATPLELPLHFLHLVQMAAGVLGEEVEPLVQVDLAQAAHWHPHLAERACPAPQPREQAQAP
jgi:hypothetical protein